MAGVYQVAFAPNGEQLAAGCGDGSVQIWKFQQRKLEKTLWGHDSRHQPMRFSPETSKYLALAGVVGGKQAVRIWNLWTGKLEQTRMGEIAVDWTADSTHYATAQGNFIKVWNLRTGALHRRMAASGPVQRLAFAPDKPTLATEAMDGSISVWDIGSAQMVQRFEGMQPESPFAFSARGDWLAGCGKESATLVWQVRPESAELQ